MIAACSLLAAALTPLAARAEAADEDDDEGKVPVVQLLTMGPGESIYERYGHGALCLHRPNQPSSDWCFNYGNAPFESLGRLAWDVLQGEAVFWVSAQPTAEVLALYAEQDRTVWRQDLPLTKAGVEAVAERIMSDASPENSRYAYHHIRDNCSTRLRDVIDEATGGRLSKGSGVPTARTYREIWRDGSIDLPWSLIGSDLVLGRSLDVAPTRWEAMFIPALLREEVRLRLGATPVVVSERRGRALTGHAGHRGRGWFLVLALLLSLLPAVALRTGRLRRAAQVVPSLTLGLLGAALWTLALSSQLAEIRWNEALLLFLPLDLAIPLVPARWRRWYLVLRVVMVIGVSAALAAGLLRQPLWAPAVMALLPLLLLMMMTSAPTRRS